MLTPLSATIANPSKLNMIVKEFDLEASALKSICVGMQQNPLEDILEMGKNLTNRFETIVRDEESSNPQFDASFSSCVARHRYFLFLTKRRL